MNHNPQTLTSPFAVAVLAVFAIVVALSPISPVSLIAQEDAPTVVDANAAAKESDKPQTVKSEFTSDQVFEKIREKLEDAETLSCDIHQMVMLSGRHLRAVGRYAQATGNRMRLDYRIYSARATNAEDAKNMELDAAPQDVSKLKPNGSMERVSDGSVLWTKWKNGPHQQLTRRNISEIMEALSDVPNETSVKSLQSLGVGGLQTLMSQLQVGMDFGEVRELKTADTDRLILVGRWNEKSRKDVFKLPEDSNAALPDYIPDYVRLYVDAASKLPVRIQYLKKHQDPSQSKVRPLVTLDFRNFALNFDLDDPGASQLFEFVRDKDDQIKEEDLTSSVIESIKKIATDTPEEDAAGKETDGKDITQEKTAGDE